MSTETFQPGDVVTLKGQKTLMTVEAVAGDTVSCVWFNNNTVERDKFKLSTLRKMHESAS